MYNLDKIYWLIENCKTYGTLPFAGLARAGFVGTEILKSLKDKELINDAFQHKIFAIYKNYHFRFKK